MQTVDQLLLKWARTSANEVLKESPEVQDKYRTAVKGAPAFIQGCGLVQSIAFFEAKAKAKEGNEGTNDQKGYVLLLRHLATAPDLTNLRTEIATMDLPRYVFATRRTQSALGMLKRMVDAYLPEKKDAATKDVAAKDQGVTT